MNKFYTSDELHDFFDEHLPSIDEKSLILNSIDKLLYNYEPNTQEILQNYVKWIHVNPRLKVYNTSINQEIYRYNACLHDVRIDSRQNDDHVYNASMELRAKIARGTTILEASDKSGRRFYDLIIFALRKFTGGFGDEDTADNKERPHWRKYFLRPISETKQVVSLRKANGEAAHLSCRHIDGEFYLCSGSKNVHMLYKKRSEIDTFYNDSKYAIAREVSYTIITFLKSLSSELRNCFLSFLSTSRLTCVFEILQPENQHIEDLSYLSEPLLKFITFTETKLEDIPQSLCFFIPDHALEIAKLFNLSCVESKRVSFDHIDDHIREIRDDHGYEGNVLYFIDHQNHAIGLLKKKTVWYIILRALREKLRGFVSPKSTITLADLETRVKRRIQEISLWIGFDGKAEDKWIALANLFLNWIARELKTARIDRAKFIPKYPTFWTKFIKENGINDKIKLDFKNEQHLFDETLEPSIIKLEESKQHYDDDQELILSKAEKKKIRKQAIRIEKLAKLQIDDKDISNFDPNFDENHKEINQEAQVLTKNQKKKLRRLRKVSQKQSDSPSQNGQESIDLIEDLLVQSAKEQESHKEDDEFITVLSKKEQRRFKQQQIMAKLIDDENET